MEYHDEQKKPAANPCGVGDERSTSGTKKATTFLRKGEPRGGSSALISRRMGCASSRPRSRRASGGACDSLTKLDDPSIDWCKLAEGYGVRGVRTTTCEEFADAFARALDADGPTLIDAVLEA